MTPLVPTTPQSFPEILGYRLTEQLYLGSRTAVYRSVKTATQHPVVIKVLRREYPSFSELVQFRNQYTIVKDLPISGIVHPLSLEPLGSSYALVMEDWGGIALNEYFKQQQLSLTEVLTIALQLADILHDLGQHRVVHKDIKPANILIQPESKQVKLIDFSIASLLPKESQEIQSANILEGTLAYLAPEQTGRMNRGIDYRTDFYALGVTLYQLLGKKLPFESDDPLEVIHCHIAKQPLSLEQVNPAVPGMVAAIVRKLMAKNAEDRYQSAKGLQYDLEQCLMQWKANHEISDFELGQRDLSDRFLIPEKLYGREQEVQTLLNAFDRVADGASELMLVAGFSGIGKTAVVHEVHKPIVRQRGYFIKGKFDQFNRNIPLSAFVQALRDLMGQLLSESDGQLAQWQAKILAAVGENGQVLIDVIPELEQIIGKQPPAPELSGSAAQNRFNLLFQKFIEVFTTAEHPLVVFLDDLQWADSASLQLIKLLMSDNGYLLMLGAYRDNEVSPVHPFILTVEEIRKANAIVNTITLAPLDLADTNHLVADTLNCSRELAKPLTELIDRKTQGNPFFTTQFLKALHNDGQILFDLDRGYWECDIAQVNALALTDDVVEFMALQLQKLPAETQQVLKLVACLGNQFDLATLAIVLEQSPTEAATALWKALQEGLILPTSQIYKFFQSAEQSSTEDIVNPTYRFLHDRVQQAAYSLIPDADKQITHLSIGRLLLVKTDNNLQHISSQRQADFLFDIVSHLNQGVALITQRQEKDELVQLNLQAGRRAKAATAFRSAADYYRMARTLIADISWETNYACLLEIYTESVEVSFLEGNFEHVDSLAQHTLENTRVFIDGAKVHEIKIQTLIAQNQPDEAIQLGLEFLDKLGFTLPSQVSSTMIEEAFEQNDALLKTTPFETIATFELIEDIHKEAIVRMITIVGLAMYTANPSLLMLAVAKQVNLCIQYGNTSTAADAYATYGLFLCGEFGNIEQGYKFGQLALDVLEKLQTTAIKSLVYVLVYGFIKHWRNSYPSTLPYLQQAYQFGLETGDLQNAALSAYIYCLHLFICGDSLIELQKTIKQYLQAIESIQQMGVASWLRPLLWSTQQLIASQESPGQLCESDESEPAKIHEYHQADDRTGAFLFAFNQCYLAYLLGDNELATQQTQIARECLDGVTSMALVPIFYFYDTLILLAQAHSADEQPPETIEQKFQLNVEKLKTWAHYAPENIQHRLELVQAEYQHLQNNPIAALESYDRAIAGAKANGFIQEEALANELAAKFYLNWGKEKVSAGYMQEAYYRYAHWGATAKIQDLEQRYPHLLAPILQQQRTTFSVTETLFSSLSTVASQTIATHSTIGETRISDTLNLATILKASQALSSEIQLDKLLTILLHTVIENAGADKGLLLMPHDQQWSVEAIATLDQPAQVKSIPLANSLDLPHSLIHIVKRSVQPMVIVDAPTHPTLATDDYVVQQKPKSILCAPILQQGKLVAILYLENQVTVGAFTGDRVGLLNVLCAQAAISLENARIYEQAQDYARQLEQSQLQTIQSEKMASLGNLVAGVAHEINNPIGFLSGSINHARDYVKDLLGHLALYQQHHPNAAAPVQDNAGKIDLEFLSEDFPKLLNSMEGATDRITSISTSLRTFSRADTEHKVRADLHEGIDSTILILKYRLKANEHRPAIEVIQDYGYLPSLDCFPGQLNQVFMNILANAIDIFDEMAQKQSFDELKAKPQQITIRTTTESKQVQIQICDNGKGMTEDVKARIFDHLFTTKGVGKGTGLGLAIARQIVVEKHGGSLTVHSALGKGTEFCIRLPIGG